MDREVQLDCSIVRVHQHAAGTRRTTASHTWGGRVALRAQ